MTAAEQAELSVALEAVLAKCSEIEESDMLKVDPAQNVLRKRCSTQPKTSQPRVTSKEEEEKSEPASECKTPPEQQSSKPEEPAEQEVVKKSP